MVADALATMPNLTDLWIDLHTINEVHYIIVSCDHLKNLNGEDITEHEVES